MQAHSGQVQGQSRGRGVQGVQGCLGGSRGLPGGGPWGVQDRWGNQGKKTPNQKKIEKAMEGEKGEVKPPKCPTRQSDILTPS